MFLQYRILLLSLIQTRQPTEVGQCEQALHRMLGRVPWGRSAGRVASGAEIVVIAHETFVAIASKVALLTRVATDP